jgi:hypothetical protein
MRAERVEGAPTRERGRSLAKGPVALIGLASLAFGILGFIFGSQSFHMDPPSGTVNGGMFIGVEGNGWTWALFAAGGLLLLLSSPAHWTAKSVALIVGLAYGAAALIGLSDGSDVFGIFAVNGWTELIFGVTGVVLLLLAFVPLGGRRREPVAVDTTATDSGRFARRREPVDTAAEPASTPEGTAGDPRATR